MNELINLSPQLIVLGFALLILLVEILFGTKRSQNLSLYAGLLGSALALASLYWVQPTVTLDGFHIDKFGMIGTGIILFCTFLILTYSFDYLNDLDLPANEWTFFLLSAALGLTLMFNTYHLLVVFVGLELSSLSFYVLCGYNRSDLRSAESSLKYFILGSVGSAVFLLGISLVYATQQTVVINQFQMPTEPLTVSFSLGILVLMIGLIFKLALVPFHVWVPDVYEGAPTPITAFMSVSVKIAVLCAIVRILLQAGTLGTIDWSIVFWWFSALTILGGNILALVQDNLKRMLAYSSIAHAGYLGLGLVAANNIGISAILFYLIIYTFMNVTAFGIVSYLALLDEDEEEYFYSSLNGLSVENPLIATVLAICMISLSGLPPTAGFMGKLFLFYGVVEAGYTLLAVIAVIGSLISVAYYFRVIVHSFMKSPSNDSKKQNILPSWFAYSSVLVSGFFLIYFGLHPQLIFNPLLRVVTNLTS